MGLLWGYYGAAMGLLWDCHGTAVGLLWGCYAGCKGLRESMLVGMGVDMCSHVGCVGVFLFIFK